VQAPWWWSKNETCRSDIYVYFNVNFNVFFKLIKVHCLWVNCTYTRMHGATTNKQTNKPSCVEFKVWPPTVHALQEPYFSCSSGQCVCDCLSGLAKYSNRFCHHTTGSHFLLFAPTSPLPKTAVASPRLQRPRNESTVTGLIYIPIKWAVWRAHTWWLW
jgi:hypothetical protein